MNRKKLANEVTDFCLEYGIFNISRGTKEIKQRIEEQFEDVVFVEELINMIILKAKNQKDKDLDIDRLIILLSDLDRLRLELEYKKPERSSEEC